MSPNRRVRGLSIAAAAAAALVAGSLGAAAVPAAAVGIGGCSTTAANGIIGVTQQLGVQDCNGSGQVTVDYQNGSPSQILPTFPGPGDTALANWAPTSTGTAFVSIGGVSTNTVTISATPTTTTITTPNTVTVGKAVQIYVVVQSNSPSAYQPKGSITVVDANNAKLGGFNLTPGNPGQSYGYYWWTPSTAGTYFFKAVYSGETNAQSSSSPLDTIIASPSGGTISISAPATMTQGQPVTLTATVQPAGTQGSVGFTVNGAPISASIPIGANGQASFLWTPNVVGQITLGASYTTNAGGSGSTSEKVTVNAGPVQKDVITLVQPGWGPWNPNGTYTLGNGSNFAFQASTLSGAGVTLSETGPCQVSGLTITIPTGSGQCNLVATSPGGNGYAGVQYGYTVSLIPGNQTATLSAPQSGNVNAGKTLTLESPSQQDTNAGQNITWKITKGKNSVCTLKFPSSGAVKLKINKKGQCNVTGSAPGVAGQWNPFTVTRSYRGV